MTFVPLYGALLVLLLGVLIYRSNRRLIKGWVGELSVNLSARYFLDRKVYHLLNNVTLPSEDGTTQIDHIIVSLFGVFVVETKNMKGWIFGQENDQQWTQQIYKNKNKFPNPLEQNYRHRKSMEEIFGLRPETIFSVIVFAGDSEFKTKMPENVTDAQGYLGYIQSKQEPLFGHFEVRELIEKIEKYRLETGLNTNLTHIKNLENKYPKKIRRKLTSAKPTPPIRKYSVFAVVLMIFIGVAKNSVFKEQEESVQHEIETQKALQEDNTASTELNKVYQVQDSKGKTHYTNIATAPNAKLLSENPDITKSSLPIEIIDDKVIIPITLSNKGAELKTSLVLDRNSEKTVLPRRIADFVKAEVLEVTGYNHIEGKLIPVEARRISYFKIGSVTEENFMFWASDTHSPSQRGILGMDFIERHPFQIDTEKNLLIWK